MRAASAGRRSQSQAISAPNSGEAELKIDDMPALIDSAA